MRQSQGKGDKNRRKKRPAQEEISEPLPQEGECVVMVLKVLSGSRYHVYCDDGIERFGILRCNKGKVFIQVGDTLLCGKRDFQDTHVDILYRYKNDSMFHFSTVRGDVQ